jgi:uncharacterized protein YdaU (DUF1376 family)
MSLDWYPWYAAHYRRDTLHLTLAEDGAYRRLIDEYMARGGPLPDDDTALARILGTTIQEWLSVAPKIRPFFRKSGDVLKNPRCDKELHARAMHVHSKRINARKAAASRWEKQNETNELDASALQTQSPSNADAMQNDATLHYNTNQQPFFAEPREELSTPRPSQNRAASPALEAAIKKKGWSPPDKESGLPRKEGRQANGLGDGRSLEQIVRDKGWTAEEPPITSKLLA